MNTTFHNVQISLPNRLSKGLFKPPIIIWMRMTIPFILITIIILGCSGRQNKTSINNDTDVTCKKDSINWVLGDTEFSKKEIERYLNEPSANLLKDHVLINNQQDLIQIAETILFKIYGKQLIIHERPYIINLIGDYWIMEGTLHAELGGTFCIVIDRKTCEVKGISHGK